MAVGLQSIGYRQFYERVFALTGVTLRVDDITSLFLRKEDQDKLWRKQHRRKEGVKIIRMRKQYKKLRDGVEKLKADNLRAFSYGSGMTGPGAEGVEVRQQGPSRKPRSKQKHPCPHCGSTTHSQKSSTVGPANPKYAIPAMRPDSTDSPVEPVGTRNISSMCDMLM